jgi:hypothetical protein
LDLDSARCNLGNFFALLRTQGLGPRLPFALSEQLRSFIYRVFGLVGLVRVLNGGVVVAGLLGGDTSGCQMFWAWAFKVVSQNWDRSA